LLGVTPERELQRAKATSRSSEGASVALNRRFGAALRRRHANWYGTGEPYRFYVRKLRWQRQREAGDRRGGQAMIRVTRSALPLVVLAATWIVWTHTSAMSARGRSTKDSWAPGHPDKRNRPG